MRYLSAHCTTNTMRSLLLIFICTLVEGYYLPPAPLYTPPLTPSIDQRFDYDYRPLVHQQVVVYPDHQQQLYQPPPPVPGPVYRPPMFRLPNTQTYVVPIRAVYTLPWYMEQIVQRIQNHYSVYNPPGSLVLNRPYHPPVVHQEDEQVTTASPPSDVTVKAETATEEAPAATTEEPEAEEIKSEDKPEATTEGAKEEEEGTNEEAETTEEAQEATTESGTQETTTDADNYIKSSDDTSAQGYSYDAPPQGRQLLYPNNL